MKPALVLQRIRLLRHTRGFIVRCPSITLLTMPRLRLNKTGRFPLILIAFGVLCFAFGGIAAHFRLAPYEWIHKAIVGGKAWQQKTEHIRFVANAPAPTKLAKPEVTHKEGAFEGLTLYVPSASTRAVLVDMEGNTLHEWRIPFSRIWPGHPHVRTPLPDRGITWFDAHVFPNGDLLVVHEGHGDAPWGYGLAKIDKDSKPLWTYDANVHHKMDIAANGDIYAISQKILNQPVAFVPAPIMNDYLVILSPDGEVREEISLLEIILDSTWRSILEEKYEGLRKKYDRLAEGDYLHTNSVHVLSEDMARHFPMFKPGQVLLSFRSLNLIAVLDIPSRKLVWGAEGSWRAQHHPRFSPDGTILFFDNKGGGRGRSLILRHNPATGETAVAYEGSEEHPFFTDIRGMQQELPNGNILITESDEGRLFEVTPRGEIVWEFLTPYRVRQKRLVITTGLRYLASELPFVK